MYVCECILENILYTISNILKGPVLIAGNGNQIKTK